MSKRVSKNPLILNRIYNLAQQNAEDHGAICNPGVTINAASSPPRNYSVIMDRFAKPTRSMIMSRVRSRGTSAERKVQECLDSLGIQYLKNVSTLIGSPDIVIPGLMTVLFINGCFWHQHSSGHCIRNKTPRQNAAYWRPKLQRNVDRDRKNARKLRQQGWSVITIWECSLSDATKLRQRLHRVLASPLE